MRVKRLLISPELLMRIGSGAFRVAHHPVPDDAQLRQATIDHDRGLVVLFIESQEFPEVDDGCVPPAMKPMVITRVRP